MPQPARSSIALGAGAAGAKGAGLGGRFAMALRPGLMSNAAALRLLFP